MITEMLVRIVYVAVDILNSASVWLVASFILAGLLHNLLKPGWLQRMLGNSKLSSIVKATLSGMLLPMCSCGVIPLGLGLYYSGAYLGPTLAFMCATPIINPAAVLLAYGFLGPQIATIYLIAGFTVPLLIGVLGNKLGGSELYIPGAAEAILATESMENLNLGHKLKAGIVWGFMEMGLMVSKYVCIGMLLAGLIIALTPAGFIQQYLGDPGLLSLVGIAFLGAMIYVCAVGHIPFIAALVASGAAPGVAITFLLAGTATNLPELISMFKMIGRRGMAIYALGLIGASFLIGGLTNLWLVDFTPVFDLSQNRDTVQAANLFIFSAPDILKYLCSGIVVGLGFYAFWPSLKRLLVKVTHWAVLIILLSVVAITFGCAGDQQKIGDSFPADRAEMRNDPALIFFNEGHPDKKALILAQGDVNNTGIDDLIVIYEESKGKNMLVIIYDDGAEVICSNPLAAPVERQMIEFRDIDQKPPLEFIVSGYKGAKFGYAIYRLENDKLEDLFGEGMKDCC